MSISEQICFLQKDTLVIKSPKKPPLTWRMVVLFFAMVCGVYMCSICVKQINPNNYTNHHTISRFLNVNVVDHKHSCSSSGDHSDLDQSELPYIHYPNPQTFTREECACNPVRYFVILSMQRSGSGWFETLLNSHMNVSSNGEIFSVQERRANISMIIKTMDRVFNLDWFTSASKNECTAAIGFKWMLNQGVMRHENEIVEYLKRKGVSVIFLFRRNLLRRMISVLANSYDKNAKPLNGTHKSHVHSSLEAAILAKYKPKINATLMIKELNEAKDTSTRAIEYFKTTRHIVLYYEDVVKNRTKLKEVQEFLRLPYRELKSRQVKIHTSPLSDQLENWDDVNKALNGTSFQTFLY